jgi:hypothetical protein
MCRSPVTIEKHQRALERLMASGGGLCFSSTVYRTKAIAAAAGFREEEEPFGDLTLLMRIALDWDFAYIAKPLVGLPEASGDDQREHRGPAGSDVQ